MSDPADTNDLIGRLPDGGRAARDALIARTVERFRVLARQMLRADFPRVRRWEETDDVLQNAMLRLYKALEDVTPESARHYRNLAAQQIRRELLDLADRHAGPRGVAANHHSDGSGAAAAGGQEPAAGPASVAEWRDFYRFVSDGLADDARRVFELIHHFGWKQEQVAEELGVSVRTVKRRWLDARLALAEKLKGGPSA